jgi:DNA modification methylase
VREWLNQPHVGDCRALMRSMIADRVKVQCIVTSPPYWGGLRDYGHKGQFGLESTPQLHVRRMVATFRLARELLRADGTLWLNYGDSYMHSGGHGTSRNSDKNFRRQAKVQSNIRYSKRTNGLKPKDMVGMPWRVALALQADGWYLRSCIIWHKTNPMPESTRDRPTTAHEYIFLLSKGPRYFYDAAAVRETASKNSHPRRAQVAGWDKGPGSHDTMKHASNGVGFGYADAAPKPRTTKFGQVKNNESFDAALAVMPEDRNMRSVWAFPTEAFKGAHFATFPRELVTRCVLAGTKPNDTVFDPFLGSGTTAEVSVGLGRHYIGLEINASYVDLFKQHRSTQMGIQL